MGWTKEKPTEEGTYLHKDIPGGLELEWELYRLPTGELVVKGMGGPVPLSKWGGQWKRIQEQPEEATK